MYVTKKMACTTEQGRFKYVYAKFINDDFISYPCWYCYTTYKKDGYPCKNAEQVQHKFPSNGDKTRREIFISADHCPERNKAFPCGFPSDPDKGGYGGYCLLVDHDTVGSIKKVRN